MCGITAVLLAGADTANGVANGLLRSGEAATARDWALTASKCLTHRGPDWFGCWPGKFARPASESQSRVAFGHTRLAVVKPETGAQPIVRKDEHGNTKTVLVVNGEIYNYKFLLDTYLKNHSHDVRSDCEVIAMLYEEFKDFEKVMNLIDGDFAFCLYDLQADCIFVGRDRMGVDPLYIGHTAAGSLLFSSEMKAIHRWCVQVDQVDPGAILTYNYNSAKGMWMVSENRHGVGLAWLPVERSYLRSTVKHNFRKEKRSCCPGIHPIVFAKALEHPSVTVRRKFLQMCAIIWKTP